jgi:mitochondrial translocator assembly and maintenance protein 41
LGHVTVARTTSRSFSATLLQANSAANKPPNGSPGSLSGASKTAAAVSSSQLSSNVSNSPSTVPSDWDENPDYSIDTFSQLPHTNFGINQHMEVNQEFKEALRQILWKFKAPVRYAFAYGSGVFSQDALAKKSGGEGKMIDMIFGVSYSQHWHDLNLREHRDHYSALGSLGSNVVARVQDNWGAGVYFNPYVTVNGTLIKYGVVNIDTLYKDLSEWNTLYLAGRLQKPVKILRDDPKVRLANQVNLLSAVRTALLLLPPKFTERELYGTIAGISYMGDPRMSLPTENPHKVANIVDNQLPNFRRLYAPLIENLPNIEFQGGIAPEWQDPRADATLEQDMEPIKRGNMVRRLPKGFREKLYFHYQRRYQIPQLEFDTMLDDCKDEDSTAIKRHQGGPFEQRIAQDDPEMLRKEVGLVIKKTIGWPSTSQSLKSFVTAGFSRSLRYLGDKWGKWKTAKTKEPEVGTTLKPDTAEKGAPQADGKKAKAV